LDSYLSKVVEGLDYIFRQPESGVKAIKKRDKVNLSTIRRFPPIFIHNCPNQFAAAAHRFLFSTFF